MSVVVPMILVPVSTWVANTENVRDDGARGIGHNAGERSRSSLAEHQPPRAHQQTQ